MTNTYKVNNLPASVVIGRQTETGVFDLRIDCTPWLALWPELDLSIWVTPPGGVGGYPAATHLEGSVLVWDVNAGDTAVDGKGTLEVVGLADGLKKLSAIVTTEILRTTTEAAADPPEEIRDWYADVMAGVNGAEGSATRAAESATAAEAARVAAEAAALAIVNDVTGDVVSVADATSRPAVSLVTHIEPAQEGSGDPAPDNVRPISGWDNVSVRRNGKNFMTDFTFDNYTTAGITWKNLHDGTITATGTATDSAYTYGLGNCVLGVLPAGPYAAAFFPADSATAVCLRVGKKTEEDSNAYVNSTATGKNVVYFNTDGVSVYRIGLYIRKGSTVNGLVIKPQIERDALTDYEPPLLQTLTADLPETVYGGALDWTTGELTVTHSSIRLDGTQACNSLTANNRARFWVTERAAAYGGGVSERFAYDETVYLDSRDNVGFYPHGGSIYVRFGSASSVNTTALATQYFADNPTTFVYRLETPRTIQLTPQQLALLKGANTVYSDCGSTDLVYIADAKLYIDRKIAAIAAAVVNE